MKRAVLAVAAGLLSGCSAVPAAVTVSPAPVIAAPARGHFVTGAADAGYLAFTASTGVRPAIVEHYVRWYQPFDASFAGPAEPLIQIEPRHAPLAAVAAGKYDSWLRSYARQARAYGKPVILGFAPEMNGPWYAWGYGHVRPPVYVAAWRHVVTVFREAGASNVTWMWTVNVAAPGVSSPSVWWPGSRWADMAGIDGYFTEPSQTFANRIAPTVARIREFWRGPVLLSETAVAPAAGEAAEIPDLFAGAAADHLAGLVWFNLPGNQDWRLRGPAALAAFRAAAREYG